MGKIPPKLPPRPNPGSWNSNPTIEIKAVNPLFPEEEPKTGKTNQALAIYSSLLSHYDQMSNNKRLKLVDIASMMVDMSELECEGLVNLIIKMRER